jgi:UrcA family protein
MNRLIPLAAVAALSVSLGITHAASVGVRTETVRFADLDTNGAVGAAVLLARIKNASENVCRDLNSKALSLRFAYRDCLHAAVASAVRHVDRPALTNYASAQGYRVIDAAVARNN